MSNNKLELPNWNQDNLTRDNLNKMNLSILTLSNNTMNAIKGSASGNPIRLDDVSPLEHKIAVSVKNKNLFYFAEDLIDSGETDMGAWNYEVKKGTSKITLNTAAHEGIGSICINIDLSYLLNQLDPNKQYTLSIVASSDRVWGMAIFGGGMPFSSVGGASPVTFYPSQIPDTTLMFEDWGSIGELRFQIEEGITATEYISHDVTGTTVRRYGKNLFPIAAPSSTTGVSLNKCAFLPKGRYTVSMNRVGDEQWRLMFTLYDKNGVRILEEENQIEHCLTGRVAEGAVYHIYSGGGYYITPKTTATTITITLNDDYYLWVSYGNTNGTPTNAQVELGETATEYEPYVNPASCDADENGKVQGITANGEAMTLIAENGATITAEYNKDANKVFERLINAIISLP